MNTISSTIDQLTITEMYAASRRRDSSYDGVFFMAVKTTGIFCRPGCPARMPLEKNVEFFAAARDALSAGFRPCKKCHPLELSGAMPNWLEALIEHFEQDPCRKWKDQDIRNFGVDPKRVSRWFQKNHGITFHSFLRSRRLSTALAQLSVGDDPTVVALNAGFESLSGFREAFQKWFGGTPGAARSRRHPTPDDQLVVMVNRLLTPLGPMLVAASDQHLYLLEFADRRMLQTQFERLSRLTNARFVPGDNDIIAGTTEQIEQYYSGDRLEFEIPLALPGTKFQAEVWSQLQSIPYGKTTSYEKIATKIGKPNAQLAVGRANGDNRLAIIVPCHRVIRSDGSLSGYGGGVRRKQWMLDMEMRRQATDQTLNKK